LLLALAAVAAVTLFEIVSRVRKLRAAREKISPTQLSYSGDALNDMKLLGVDKGAVSDLAAHGRIDYLKSTADVMVLYAGAYRAWFFIKPGVFYGDSVTVMRVSGHTAGKSSVFKANNQVIISKLDKSGNIVLHQYG
jgi:hypothetical protein